MRLNGAGYTGVTPHWDPGFALFDASLHGAPVGGMLAIAAYLLFFSWHPPALVARSVPTLFAFTLVGALPGIWLGAGALFSVVLLFLGGCVLEARRLSRQRPEVAAPSRVATP